MASETEQAAMIDITVKTLDGQNRTFNVSEDLNVQQLKERISSSVEIPADKQRLIYQGRVMQDNQILKSYNIHGKVIHLVQRAPPTTLSGSSAADSAAAPTPSTARPQFQVDGNLLNVQINLGRVQGTPTTAEARGRVRQAEFNLRIINDVLSQLGSLESLPTEPTVGGGQESSSSGQSSRPVSSAATINFSENRIDGSGANQPSSTSQETNDQGLTAVALANFLDQVLDTQTRALSRIRQYQDLLRNEENYLPNSREVQNAQEVVNRVTEIFHALGHMMHSLSDITVNMSTSVPRQAVAASLAPFQMPGAPGVATPIQVNVRSRQDNRNRQRPRTSTTTSTTANTNTTPSTATAAQTTSAGSVPDLSTTTETTTQTSVSSTFQPLQMNITSSGDSRVAELYPTTVTVHDVTTIVTQGLGADSTSDSDTSSDSDSDETTTANRTNVTIRSLNPSAARTSTPSKTTTSTSSKTTSTSSKTASSAPSKATPSAPSKATPSAPSTAASSPPQRPAGTTYTSSTSTSSTITFGSGMDLDGMHLPGSLPQMPQVPGLPSDFFQNIFGSLLNTGSGTFPGRSVQVNVVQEVTTSEETATGSEEQQLPNRTSPRSRERSNRQRSPAEGAEVPSRKNASPNSRPRHAGSASAGKKSGTTTTSTSTSPASTTTISTSPASTTTTSTGPASTTTTSTGPASTTTTSTGPASTTTTSAGPASNTNTTNVSTSTTNSTRIPSQRASLSSRIPPNLGPHSRPLHVPRPYQFNLGPALQARHQHPPARPQQPESLLPLLLSHAHQGYVDPYLPCSSSQYTSQTAARALPGQARPQQQIPNLSAMVSGMVGEILGQASQQAANTAGRTSAGNTPTSAAPNPSPAGATSTTSAGGSQPTTVHNPIELLSHLLGATGGSAGQVGSVPAEFGAMVGSLMQAMTAPSAPTSTPTGNATTAPTLTMADFLSHIRSVRNDGSTDTSVMNSILETIAPRIGLSDLFSLVMGNGQILSQVRQPLQELLTSLVSQHGSIQQVVEVVLNDFSTDIQYLQSLAVVKDGVDIACSVNNCLRTHLLLLFTDIHSGNTGSVGNFGVNLYARWSRMLAELTRLCVYCLRNGYPGFLRMLQGYISRITQDMNPAVTSWMAVPMQSFVESFYLNHPVPESDIMGYVVSRDTAAPTVPSSQEQGKPESKPSTTNVPVNLIHTSDSAVNHADLSGPTFSSTTESPDSQSLETSQIAEDSEAHKSLDVAQEAPTDRQPPAIHPSTLVTLTAAGVNGAADVNSDEWQSVVPQDWIPVISQDTVTQQVQRLQPPFSDAYLQGLPVKRRRMMSLEHSRGMGNMLQYLPESIKRAAKTADVKPVSSDETVAQEAADNVDLQAELEKEITGILEARINSDKDFNLDRFPNSEEYFHRSKQ